jgi:hypothetical protein
LHDLDAVRCDLDASLTHAVGPWVHGRYPGAPENRADPLLALRAEQLTSQPSRDAIARTIHNLIDAAEEPWHGSRPPLQRDDVLAAREELFAVARRLSGPEQLSPQVVALAAQLVWDCASPIYAAGDFSVWEWARAIAA